MTENKFNNKEFDFLDRVEDACSYKQFNVLPKLFDELIDMHDESIQVQISFLRYIRARGYEFEQELLKRVPNQMDKFEHIILRYLETSITDVFNSGRPYGELVHREVFISRCRLYASFLFLKTGTRSPIFIDLIEPLIEQNALTQLEPAKYYLVMRFIQLFMSYWNDHYVFKFERRKNRSFREEHVLEKLIQWKPTPEHIQVFLHYACMVMTEFDETDPD